MRKEILSIALVALFVSTPCCVLAAQNYAVQNPVSNYAPVENNYGYQTQYPVPNASYQNQGYYNANNLRGNVVMVPANTAFPASLMTPLDSQTTRLGDNVTFYLGSDFYYGKNLIAAAGSRVNGTVILAKKGGFGNRNGKIQVRFSNIITPNGQMIPMSGRIQTEDGTGILKAGTAKDVAVDYAKDATVGAAAGAVLGTAMGALSGGSVGRGAVYGTAVGGGMGLVKTAFQKGNNVVIPQNAQLNIVLDQPITVSGNHSY